MKRLWFVIFSAMFLLSFTLFEKESEESKKGREAYASGDFDKAEKEFSRAAERLENNPEAYYNSGNAKMKRGDTEGALLDYSRALETGLTDRGLKSRIFHNMANGMVQLGKYKEAEKLYIRSLMESPEEDTAANLEIVRRLLQEQEQEEEDQDKDKDEDKDEDEDEDEDEDTCDQDQSDDSRKEDEEDQEEDQSALDEPEEEKEQEIDESILRQFDRRKNLQISPFMLKKDGRSESGQTW